MKVERVRVGDVLALRRREVAIDPEAEYRLIGIFSFGKGIFHRDPKPGAELGDYRFFAIQPGDLVLSNIQAWEGAIAYATEGDAGTIGTHRFLSYIPKDDRIDAAWARWFFLSEPGMELIRRAAPGTTVRNRTLAIERFEALEIPLPPMEDQHRVAAYLDGIACLSRAVLQTLDQIKPVDYLAKLPAFVDAAMDELVERRECVGELVRFVSDTVHPEMDIGQAGSFVGLQHIQGHTGMLTGSDPLGEMKGRKFRFQPGDILYGYLRPYLNKVWVADRHGLCSVDQYVLRPHPGVSAELLAYGLRGQRVLARTTELTHNLQLPRLRSGLLSSVKVPVVTDDQLELALARLSNTSACVTRLVMNRQRQQQVAGALIPSAMKGAFAALN